MSRCRVSQWWPVGIMLPPPFAAQLGERFPGLVERSIACEEPAVKAVTIFHARRSLSDRAGTSIELVPNQGAFPFMLGGIGPPPRKTVSQWVVCDHFVLIAAMNPCPCGYYGDAERECTCAKTRMANDQPLPEAHLDPAS